MKRWEVDSVTGCWVWLLSIDRRGYGRITHAGVKGYLAHRWAYEQLRGPIPEGLTVDHLCFNPACVNPDHLRLLTHEENSANQRSAAQTHCKNGHEFTPENTYLRPYGSGKRRTCRACQRKAVAAYEKRKRAAA